MSVPCNNILGHGLRNPRRMTKKGKQCGLEPPKQFQNLHNLVASRGNSSCIQLDKTFCTEHNTFIGLSTRTISEKPLKCRHLLFQWTLHESSMGSDIITCLVEPQPPSSSSWELTDSLSSRVLVRMIWNPPCRTTWQGRLS